MNPALVCLPTYNERENIESIVNAVLEADPRVDVLVVDDGSPDGTGELADGAGPRLARACTCSTARRRRASGGHTWRPSSGRWSAATAACWRWTPTGATTPATSRCCSTARPPMPTWCSAAAGWPGAGRSTGGWGGRLISRGGSLYARSILGLGIRDLTGGFKCFRAEVLRAIDLDTVNSTGYAFQIELTYRALRRGFRVVEVPIVFEDRRVGQSKMSRAIVLEALTMVWKIR